MTKWIFVVVLIVMAFSSDAIAQSKDSIVGTWRLVSSTDTTDTGEVKDAYGLNPTGFLMYTADGRMMGMITYGARKPISVPDPVSAPAEERAEAFATLVAYGGRYTVAGDRVIHHVEISWMQNMVNTDRVRFIVKFDGNRLTLRTPPFLKGGIQVSKEELVWERVKSETPGQ
jgi:hypothetical protein